MMKQDITGKLFIDCASMVPYVNQIMKQDITGNTELFFVYTSVVPYVNQMMMKQDITGKVWTLLC